MLSKVSFFVLNEKQNIFRSRPTFYDTVFDLPSISLDLANRPTYSIPATVAYIS